MQSARVLGRDEPFTPIVGALVGQPVDSPAWLEACGIAGPAEIEFALEIVAQRKRKLLTRQCDIDAELIEIERGY